MKKTYRILALVLALLMVIPMVASLFQMNAYADNGDTISSIAVRIYDKAKSAEVGKNNPLKNNTRYQVTLTIKHSTDYGTLTDYSPTNSEELSLSGILNTSTSNSLKKISLKNKVTTIVMEGVTFNSASSGDPLLNVKISSGLSYELKDLAIPIPSEYITGGGGGNSGGSSDNESELWSSDIVVDKVIARNSKSDAVDTLEKDTPYSIEIQYTDFGLRYEDVEYMDEDELFGYLTDAGFTSSVTTKGTLKVMNSSSSNSQDFAKFRLSFKNVRWDGSATSLAFRVQYHMYNDEIVTGKESATVPQAKPVDGENAAPPTPYIIINQYSYGGGQIEAGADFSLDMSFKNTSTEIPLENIVMKLTTPEGLAIASASNTYYIEKMDAGATLSHQLLLQARPNAKVESHPLQIEFSYQYMVKNERQENKTSETIAIPVTQIDRFAVDPIGDMPEYVSVGEETNFTVSFINRGKSTVYNISGLNQPEDSVPQTEHFGNLEAGKTGTIDFSFTPTVAGELMGTVVITYEDDSMNTKEIEIPYGVFVEERMMPEPEQPFPPIDPGMIDPAGGGGTTKKVLSGLGGLFVAAPLALYIIKRVKAKENEEDIDEDF